MSRRKWLWWWGKGLNCRKNDVPSAIFGSLIRKRGEKEINGQVDGDKDKDNDNRLGALSRMKR